MKTLSTAWRAAAARDRTGLISIARRRLGGGFARKFVTLSALTAAGQLSFVAALPILSRMYTPTQFGAFAIYLAVVNIAGPPLSLKFNSALYASSSREQAAQSLALALVVSA